MILAALAAWGFTGAAILFALYVNPHAIMFIPVLIVISLGASVRAMIKEFLRR